MAFPPELIAAHLSPHNDNARTSSGENTSRATVTYRARGFGISHRAHEEDEDDLGALTSSWRSDRGKAGSGSWHNPPKRRQTIPPDQTVVYERTEAAVNKATSAILSNARDVGHEALVIAAEALRLAPVIGLAEAARVLLSIWDSVEAVETNRMSCLRLTERCATILDSVRTEIDAAGQEVADILHDPVDQLTNSFRRVEHFIQKQVARPFFKRYLRRDEDARKIMACDAGLTDSVGLFSVAIQVRMFKEIHAQGHHALPENITSHPDPNEVLAAIGTILAAQAAHDAVLETTGLYVAMRDVAVGEKVALCEGVGVGARVQWKVRRRALS